MTTRFNYLQHVRILPLEGLKGRITEISLRHDALYKVRYFTDGQERVVWFEEDELEATIR